MRVQHCVASTSGWKKDYWIAPGSTGLNIWGWPNSAFGNGHRFAWYTTYSVMLESPQREYDIAVMRLDSRVGDRTGWFGMAPTETYYGIVNTAGYPGETMPSVALAADWGLQQLGSTDTRHGLTFSMNGACLNPINSLTADQGCCELQLVRGSAGRVVQLRCAISVCLTYRPACAVLVSLTLQATSPTARCGGPLARSVTTTPGTTSCR